MFFSTRQTIRFITALSLAAVFLGCTDGAKLNTENAQYTPEPRPQDVIAGKGGEFAIGDIVSLPGRLVGTGNTGESIIWQQTSGTPVTIDDWTVSPLTFPAPEVDGIENFTFVIRAVDDEGNTLQKNVTDADGNVTTEPMQAEISVTVYDPDSLIRFEVEDESVAAMDQLVLTNPGQDQFISGAEGSHTRDFTPGSSVTFNLDTTLLENLSEGYYSLYVRYAIPASGYGSKGTVVTVNGVPYEFMVPATGTWDIYRVGVVSFSEGLNTVEIGGGWNYYRVDSITLIPSAPPAGPLPVAPTLVNPEPTAETQALIEFLTSSYGSYTLSGQTEFINYANGPLELTEYNKVVSATEGIAPAIVAFDFMDFSASRIACGAIPGTLAEDMIAQHREKNIILSALWHWNAPMHLLDATCESDVSGEAWWHGFYSTATSFDLSAALANTESDEYQALISDIDTIAAELQKFEDAGVPILWRPLHEAEGAWFWWGNAGAEALKELWILMFERFTDLHDLDNLIWVFTHAGDLNTEWYPGDQYVDIVGFDGYDGNNRDNPFSAQYATLKDRFNGKKIVALTETGTIPNVEAMHQTDAWWSFFLTWNSDGDQYGPDGATTENIAATYTYDGVLNLTDVPGGRTKYSAGIYANFEIPITPWGAQINWSDTGGAIASEAWFSSGKRALSIIKDLSSQTDFESLVFQAYPVDGIDVSDVERISLVARTRNAGESATAKLFVKYGEDWVWVDGGAQAASDTVTLEIDLSAYEWLAGIGVQFENLDTSATAAEFYIDQVSLDDRIIYDFEPSASPWESQINWSATDGQTLSSTWQTQGNNALELSKNLADITGEEPTSVVFQAYPAEGFDVSEISNLTLDVASVNSGENTSGKLFIKHGDDWEWADSGATQLSGATNLSIDISAFDWLAGIGVQFENFDPTSTTAEFYLDNVRFNDVLTFGFENTGQWDFQVNWTSVPGIHLSKAWKTDGDYSLAGTTLLNADATDVILQTYPEGGILLDEVSTLTLQAYGEASTAKLWAKDKDGTWRDAGETAMTEAGVQLTLDISDLGELQGFGVQFTGLANTESESTYFIDSVSFTATDSE